MGRAVQVVRVTTDSFELDEEALKEVLNQDTVKDLPVVVVSVAGKMRQGKSFLLNFLIHYLKHKGSDSWMDGLDEPQQGFQWRSGPLGCTTGILVWSEVFIVDGPDGQRVAVLLMDTQGTFDTNTTMKECSTVFALSTMLSCVQVYNVMRDIKRDDLDSLQLFVEYGKMAQSRGHCNKPFKSLQFLVRDWEWEDSHQLGAQGGAEFIDDRLRRTEGIQSCFEQISCFLLPYPWNKMDGQLCGLSETFKSLLNAFFSNILAWDELQARVKEVEGVKIKTKDILTHFKLFVDIFREGELPSPQSTFDANVQISLIKAYEIGKQTFEESRKVITGERMDERSPSQDPESFEESLLQCQSLAIEEFRCRATLGANQQMSEHYLTRLKEDTETIICTLVELNMAKRSNEEAIRKREKSEMEGRMAEIRMKEAEKERMDAEERLEQALCERDEIDKNQRESEKKDEKLDQLFNILKMQCEMMFEKAMQDMKEADEKRKEAERMREEAERMRRESESSSWRIGNIVEAIGTCGRIVCQVIATAAPLFIRR